MRVLIIEDEPRLARNIAQALRETACYAVDISLDGEACVFSLRKKMMVDSVRVSIRTIRGQGYVIEEEPA